MAWTNGDWGEILWQRAGLSRPDGVCYGPSGRDVVVVADRGNSRVAVMTRTWPGTSVAYLTSATLASEGLDLDLVSPSKVVSSQGILLLADARGAAKEFSETREDHPALARARRLESVAGSAPAFPTLGSGATSENTLDQYRNLSFAPLLRAKE